MTTIRQFAKLLSNKNSIKVVAASSLAIGVAATLPVLPAGAVAINTGTLNFNLTENDFRGDVKTTAPFDVNFNPSGFASVVGSTGQFSSASLFPTVFPTGSNYGITPSTGTFTYSGAGTTYRLTNDLNFAFNNGVTIRVGNGSTFDFTQTTVSSATNPLGAYNVNILNSLNSFIINGTTPADSVAIPTSGSLGFVFQATGGTPGGSVGVTAFSTAASVPEPFTIIGSIVGGTAAFRMRKKLANINKN
jgi:hypothetical protein